MLKLINLSSRDRIYLQVNYFHYIFIMNFIMNFKSTRCTNLNIIFLYVKLYNNFELYNLICFVRNTKNWSKCLSTNPGPASLVPKIVHWKHCQWTFYREQLCWIHFSFFFLREIYSTRRLFSTMCHLRNNILFLAQHQVPKNFSPFQKLLRI